MVAEIGLHRWRQCINKCFNERVGLERFETFASHLQNREVAGDEITLILFEYCRVWKKSLDPLWLQYCHCLLRFGCIQGYHVLQILLRIRITDGAEDNTSPDKEEVSKKLTLESQEAILRLIPTLYATQHGPKSQDEAQHSLRSVFQWMVALQEAVRGQEQPNQALDHFRSADLAISGTIGAIFLALVANQHVSQVLNDKLSSGKAEAHTADQRG